MKKWRFIEDEKYGGYSIQKLKRFLWWEWWSTQYYCPNKTAATKCVEQLNYDKPTGTFIDIEPLKKAQ